MFTDKCHVKICVHKLFLQARFKDKGSEIASEQLNQVFKSHVLLPVCHVFALECSACVSFIVWIVCEWKYSVLQILLKI